MNAACGPYWMSCGISDRKDREKVQRRRRGVEHREYRNPNTSVTALRSCRSCASESDRRAGPNSGIHTADPIDATSTAVINTRRDAMPWMKRNTSR